MAEVGCRRLSTTPYPVEADVVSYADKESRYGPATRPCLRQLRKLRTGLLDRQRRGPLTAACSVSWNASCCSWISLTSYRLTGTTPPPGIAPAGVAVVGAPALLGKPRRVRYGDPVDYDRTARLVYAALGLALSADENAAKLR